MSRFDIKANGISFIYVCRRKLKKIQRKQHLYVIPKSISHVVHVERWRMSGVVHSFYCIKATKKFEKFENYIGDRKVITSISQKYLSILKFLRKKGQLDIDENIMLLVCSFNMFDGKIAYDASILFDSNLEMMKWKLTHDC